MRLSVGRHLLVDDHVFATSSRINSTFGGSLVDMVRATVMLEVIERDLPDAAMRDAVTSRMFADEHVFLLGCGTRTVRFRPTLTVTDDELDAGLAALERTLRRVTG